MFVMYFSYQNVISTKAFMLFKVRIRHKLLC